ncbi:hypothetical protein CAOG_009377 [Capsaspora owczarzaki ATCC 30864]|uniref:Uncharacterized protein n=1 Tax=Capsaspora owczarzaki (strain ATCC 30864) TaxID=595528 RepID=A0A0D2U378_CAPO3|nr:hypothetical protein CAOG_009377 [Capsaspora owczarzaki ATCC 30864]
MVKKQNSFFFCELVVCFDMILHDLNSPLRHAPSAHAHIGHCDHEARASPFFFGPFVCAPPSQASKVKDWPQTANCRFSPQPTTATPRDLSTRRHSMRVRLCSSRLWSSRHVRTP